MSLKAVNPGEKNTYELEISIDGGKFQEAIKTVYNRQRKKITLPGFRKGKAPLAMVERYYGESVFYDDALQTVFPEEAQEAIKESGLKVVSQKDAEVKTIDKSGVELKMTVIVAPEVELGEYKGLKASKKAVRVTANEVAEEVKKLQDRNSRLVTVEDRPAANGDTAEIDFEGFVDGVAFDGGKGENYNLTLGSGQFIPGFEDQVAGHSAGDEFDVKVTFPEDYQEDLKGKEATFKVKVHEIKTKELPEADDEFAKDVSEFDTLDELKADLKKKISEQKEKDADAEFENELVDQLIAGMKADIPEVMFEQRIDENVNDFSYRLQVQGLNMDTYLQYTGMDMAKFRETFKEQAEKQVKIRLVLEKIAELEKLEPSEEDKEAEYKKYAENYNMDVEAIKKAIPQEEVVGDLAVRKAMELVKENAVKKAAAKKKSEESGETAEKPKTTRKKTAKKEEE